MDKDQSQEEFLNITLRKLDVSDVDDFMIWATDEKVTNFCSFHPYESKEQALDFISDFATPHPYYRAICLDNRPIGSISITTSGQDSHKGELGYLLASAYWCKGIVARAVKMVISSVFVEWKGLERVEALVDVENLRSQRVLEKCGFIREGVLRRYWVQKGSVKDMVMFSVVSSDPQVKCLIED